MSLRMGIITRGNAYVERFAHRGQKSNSNGQSSQLTPFYYNYTLSDRQIGATVPGFRELIALGKQAGSNYSRNGIRLVSPPYANYNTRVEVRNGNPAWEEVVYDGHPPNGWFGPVPSVPPLPGSIVVDEALSNFYKHYRNSQQRFNGAVFAGELRETVRLLRNPLSGVKRVTRDYLDRARRVSRNSRTQQRQIADLYLTWQFGMAPLISDIRDLVSLGNSLENHKSRYEKIYGVSGRNNASIQTGQGVTVNSLWVARQESRVVTNESVKFYGVASCKPFRGLETGSQLGFDISNFLPSIYQLLPWSFLIDYFTNLGDLIDAWSVNLTNLNWACSSHKSLVKYTWLWSLAGSTIQQTGSIRRSCSSVTSKAVRDAYRFQRVVYDQANPLPLPGLVVNLGLNSTQALNVAALFSTRFT